MISDFRKDELTTSQLRRLDMTLLLVFLGLIRHGKAADVATEMGLTQSAISQALKRLREVFSDELFLRRPHGMEPTAVALALEGPVTEAVETLRGALGLARAFDPARAEGVVRIAALDAEQASLIPPFAARLCHRAPGLRLSVLPLGRAQATDALVAGSADLAFGFFWDLPEVILTAPLFDEGFLVAGRPDILTARDEDGAPVIDLETYCARPHVLVSPAGDLRGIVDDRLEAIGRTRRVMLGLPAFLPALAVAAASGGLVTLPARLARAFAPGFGLVTAEPPIAVRRFTISIAWHRRQDADPRSRWLRDEALACLGAEAEASERPRAFSRFIESP